MFRELKLLSTYSSSDSNIIKSFYNPVLKEAISFDRISGFFSAQALSRYAQGLEYFGKAGHKYRLIISNNISKDDYFEIKQGYDLKKNISERLRLKLVENISLEEERNISNLAYLISLGIVEIKFAFKTEGIFHDKCGILKDSTGDVICFRGSNNETMAAICNNYEAFEVKCSWIDANNFYNTGIQKSIHEFELLWNNQHKDIVVKHPDATILEEINFHNKGKIITSNEELINNSLILDYNGYLFMQINTEDQTWLKNDFDYLLYIDGYVDKENEKENEYIKFYTDIGYIKYQEIADELEKIARRKGKFFYKTKALCDYLEAQNVYIEKRSNLGLEIKYHDFNDLNHRIIESFQEFKNIVNISMERKLKNQQMWNAFYMYAMTKSANFSVPGSGKTASVLGAYAYLKNKKIINRIVVIGPKNSFGSWIDEFQASFGEKEPLCLYNVQNKDYKTKNERLAAFRNSIVDCNLFLFNYEALEGFKSDLIYLLKESKGYTGTLLVFDEVHKVKNIDGKRAKCALKIADAAQYIVAMTGTPLPNSYADLYNILHILYGHEYNEFFNFSMRMLKNPDEYDVININKKIQPFFCRTTKEELKVPAANADKLITVSSNSVEQRLFEMLVQIYRNNQLALFIRVLQLESNPMLLLEKIDLNDICKILEIDYDVDNIEFADYSHEFKDLVKKIDITSKKKKCIELVTKLQSENKNIVIWCIFKDTIRSLTKILSNEGFKVKMIDGSVDIDDRIQIINEFQKNQVDVLITNPHTLAESVSLHQVCHDAIYFEYSYNLVHLLQSKDRIHRLGLPQDQYTQYYYLFNEFKCDDEHFSMDKKIYERLMLKEKIMLDAIANNVLEVEPTSEEDLDVIFSSLEGKKFKQ